MCRKIHNHNNLQQMKKNKIVGIALVGVFAFALIFLAYRFSRVGSNKTTILFITADTKAEAVARGADLFIRKYPELANKVDVVVRTESNSREGEEIPQSNIMVFHVHETEFLKRHEPYLQKIIKQSGSGIPFIRLASGQPGLKYSEDKLKYLGLRREKMVHEYVEYGSPTDYMNCISYLLNKYNGYNQIAYEKPKKKIKEGLVVYSGGKMIKLVSTWNEWVKEAKPNLAKPVVAYMTYRNIVHAELMNVENVMMAKLKKAGFQPVMMFGFPNVNVLKNYLIDTLTNKCRANLVISGTFKF